MANTQIRLTKSKLVAKDLGNPSMVKAKSDGDSSPYTLGVIFGRATSWKTKTLPPNPVTGEVQQVDAIIGMFEGRRAEPLDNKDGTETIAIRSAVLYLPSGFNEMVIEALKAVPESEKPIIDFAYKIMTVKATNPAGYSYSFETLHEPSETDPLEGLAQLVQQKTLPSPQGQPAPSLRKGTRDQADANAAV